MSFNKAKSLKTASKYVQQGKYQSAIEEYRQIAQADPADVTTLNTLGDLYVKVGQTSEAIASFLHIAEHYRVSGFYLKAIAMLKKVSKLDPGNIDVSLKLAALYAQQKLIVDARHQYLSVAEHYIREGQTSQALEIYQKIADLDPENTAIQLKLAEAYLREDQIEKAYDTFILTANEMRRQNKDIEALQIYVRAIKANPKGQAALASAVNLYLDHKEPSEAIELIESLLTERPNDAELLTLLARVHQSTNNLEGAEAALEKVLIAAPSRYQYALDLALLYVRRLDATGALRLFDRVIENLYEYREEEKAAQLLREIMSIEPQHLGVLTRLATIYEHTHDDHLLVDTLNTLTEVAIQKDSKPAAISALKRLIELEPDEIQHRRKLRELEGTTPTFSEEPSVPAYQANHYDSGFGEARSEEASDFSAYSIQVTEDSASNFAADDHGADQWSQWSISTVETQADSTSDFSEFGSEPEPRFFEPASSDFGAPETIAVAEVNAINPALRDELESVDFYLSQGMLDVARYTLESVAINFPNHPEVQAKLAQLSAAETRTDQAVNETKAQPKPELGVEMATESGSTSQEAPSIFAPMAQDEMPSGFALQADIEPGVFVQPIATGQRQESEEATIFLVPPTTQDKYQAPATNGFEVSQPVVEPSAPVAEVPVAKSFDLFDGDEMGDLMDFLDEFKAESEQHKPVEDFETHYNLGLAYKEMDMFDEAIEEFQQAFKGIMSDPMHGEYVSCCNMLAFCFAQKGLPRLAVVWLKKGLEAPGHNEEVYQALRYDLADAYAAMGDLNNAYEAFAEVYAIDVQYRSVRAKMQEIATQLGK
ncbi:MAG: tetratricopeptide repeat protein [Acidobacteria bacterium]|nr:tetratricopeptide repeat protein [Acidobacteriota bacterium]